MNDHMQTERHLSAEDVAAYLDGTMEDPSRRRVEAHASECEECRREIAEVTGILKGMRRVRRRHVWVPAVAAAAVAALIMLKPSFTGPEPDGMVRFRGPESAPARDGAVDLRVVDPTDGASVGPAAVVFVWHAGGAGASYQLTLANEAGDVVWTTATTDTMASLPDTIELAGASRYYWYVDGLLEDGRNANTGVHSFTIRH